MANTVIQLVIKGRGKVKGLRLPWGHLSATSPVQLFLEASGISGWYDGGGASPRDLQDL